MFGGRIMSDKYKPFSVHIGYDGYFSLRNKIKKRPGEELVYDVVLSVVNRPTKYDMSKTRFMITREKLNKQMEGLVGRVVGEILDGALINDNETYKLIGPYLKRLRTIDISMAAGVLLNYEISTIRDGLGAFVITGGVRVTEKAAKLLDEGSSVFTIRSLVDDVGGVVEIIGFDLIPIHNFDITK